MPQVVGGRALLNLLQTQLSFFGAIDEAVRYAKQGNGENPDAVLRTVETLLPGTTGFGQAGWYRELEDFANRPSVRVFRSPVRFPTVSESLGYLQASTAEERMGRSIEWPGRDTGLAPAQLPERVADAYDPAHDPVLARSAYAAMVLAKIDNLGGTPPEIREIENLSAQIMTASVNFWRETPDRFDADSPLSDQTVQILLDQAERVDSRRSWHTLAAQVVDPKFADQSLPCFATLEDDNGQYCSTLYTDATDDDLSVNDIERIIDPRNWSLCCKFFCSVVAQQPPYAKRGWSRILEKIGPECDEWCLKTALLFYYGRDDNGGIFVNYDLDPNRQDDSGIVEVDNGYIWITPRQGSDPSEKGVRIRSSKQERVQGLSPTATAALGSLLGWGDAAHELLAGTARKLLAGKIPGTNLKPFQTTPPAGFEAQMDSGVASPPPAGAHATLPPNFGDTVDDVRTLVNDLINRTRDVTADAVSRWLDGMTRDDVKAITSTVGTQLQEFALKVYQTAENNVKPQVIPNDKDGANG
ncbi:hypothetical protein [Mycobacterium shimoidei]|uniref:hypothetical protein n=1 Tax=Mycobacterium shimoidei TaxID=29313 RepID=UPI000DEBC8AE|nr:hypothetical protein [Mycobacterium shimoidei]